LKNSHKKRKNRTENIKQEVCRDLEEEIESLKASRAQQNERPEENGNKANGN
jgi:hypothetical protein